jgi:thiamine-phosphate pyrophosphorylase
MMRYCITDSLEVAIRAASEHVDLIQIRAKEIPARALVRLAREAVANARQSMILVNTRTDVALACGAHGVHLPARSMSPDIIRRITSQGFLIGVSCHTIEELQAAEGEGADFAVYGPVFPSVTKPAAPIGIESFRQAAGSVRLPVYALGGVTAKNARQCIEAGAAGVAGISLFA